MNSLYKAKTSLVWNFIWGLIFSLCGAGVVVGLIYLSMEMIVNLAMQFGEWLVFLFASLATILVFSWIFVVENKIVPKCNKYLKCKKFRIVIEDLDK